MAQSKITVLVKIRNICATALACPIANGGKM